MADIQIESERLVRRIHMQAGQIASLELVNEALNAKVDRLQAELDEAKARLEKQEVQSVAKEVGK